ncbi:uncharacterized protein LOC133794354 [Humulus lupulus]|uniref:uncharacterized protein LOC133794354 n=1 Tax=Humulus lupulus TaxID=3486 RepID=UPI002B409ECD|nr:uncharacterized protein LOC133794354 [Humulus lupulus]
MAPHGESIPSSTPTFSNRTASTFSKPPRLPMSESLHRTVSDISFELSKAEAAMDCDLPPISEVEDAKCECCGMVEECTPEYIEKIREKFFGKWVCGLCSEAVKEELQKKKNDAAAGGGGGGCSDGKDVEEALAVHMSACVRFNKFGRAYPVLFQAEAMRQMLKKSQSDGRIRAKSISPRDLKGGASKKGGIARSSSCIPAITRDMNDLTMTSS